MLEIAPLTVSGADLKPGTEPVQGTVRGLPVRLGHADPLTRWSLRARDTATIAAALGRAVPDRIGTHDGGIARLGPDEWLALLPTGTMVPAPGAAVFSLVDISARAVGFTVEGPGAVAALMRGCPLDLARFMPGRATRTVFETVEIQIWTMAPDHFHVEVWRSFAPWLWHSLAGGID